ncbi:MAG: hypothetical protein LBV47_02975 [Bacteroidales bacterium]|jgi:hypothetical protein|nr:hypothetical protein [Bacteroidales bacterium]
MLADHQSIAEAAIKSGETDISVVTIKHATNIWYKENELPPHFANKTTL